MNIDASGLEAGRIFRLLALVGVRTVVGALLLVYLGVQLYRVGQPLTVTAITAYILLGLVFVVTLVTALYVRRRLPPKVALWANIGFDLALSTSAVVLSGFTDSPFAFLYSLAVIGAATLLGLRAAFVSASIGFSIWVALAYYTSHATVGILAPQFAAQFLVALLSGYLSGQLGKTSLQLEESYADRERLEVLQEQILSIIPSGLVTCDAQGRVTYYNPETVRLFGTPVHIPMLEELCRLDGVESGRVVERTVKLQQGLSIVSVAWVPIASIEGARLIVFQDVSEVRRLEAELTRIDTLATMGKMSAQLAHEVRNPLAAMRGAAQLLGASEDASRARLSQLIISEIDRLNTLVGGYLEVTRPATPKRVELDLAQLVAEAMAILRADPSYVNVELALTPAPAFADPVQVKQVLLNLLRNAVAATAAKRGRVRVETSTSAGAGVLRVWDDAGAIHPEDTNRIFEPWVSRSEGGSGLGLFTVRSIVRAHQGSITVTSSPEQGTTFTVSFPGPR